MARWAFSWLVLAAACSNDADCSDYELCNPPRFGFVVRDTTGRLLQISEVSSSGACQSCSSGECTSLSEGQCEITVTTTDGRTGTASSRLDLVWNECCGASYPRPDSVTVVVP